MRKNSVWAVGLFVGAAAEDNMRTTVTCQSVGVGDGLSVSRYCDCAVVITQIIWIC